MFQTFKKECCERGETGLPFSSAKISDGLPILKAV
jgi:hypothetical protein